MTAALVVEGALAIALAAVAGVEIARYRAARAEAPAPGASGEAYSMRRLKRRLASILLLLLVLAVLRYADGPRWDNLTPWRQLYVLFSGLALTLGAALLLARDLRQTRREAARRVERETEEAMLRLREAMQARGAGERRRARRPGGESPGKQP
ncbi:MAG: hypothetical protein BWZ10_01010 [candidate division BRC1 bacterium ADurb.BinA364]|nr:MAG: hypothetical protein BWZ10_01010 [candidate division BRC1 bacterium ADurb.BinA364]